jgi:demethoxyubiquinone hydroxylase (CLK1/Coq7/Cat5 family)
MRDEEVAHGAGAIKKGAARLPRPVRELMRISAGIMTRTAYWL